MCFECFQLLRHLQSRETIKIHSGVQKTSFLIHTLFLGLFLADYYNIKKVLTCAIWSSAKTVPLSLYLACNNEYTWCIKFPNKPKWSNSIMFTQRCQTRLKSVSVYLCKFLFGDGPCSNSSSVHDAGVLWHYFTANFVDFRNSKQTLNLQVFLS